MIFINRTDRDNQPENQILQQIYLYRAGKCASRCDIPRSFVHIERPLMLKQLGKGAVREGPVNRHSLVFDWFTPEAILQPTC